MRYKLPCLDEEGATGAIMGSTDDTAKTKMRIMRTGGMHVIESPAYMGEAIER